MDEGKKYTLSIETKSLTKIIEKRNKELDKEFSDFASQYVKYKTDKLGNLVNDTNPLLVSTYFFKPINPNANVEPVYTSEQLSLVYNLYCQIIEKINMEIMLFQPSISHFCKFAGISLTGFQDLKNSYDESVRTLANKINSEIFDANMTLAQHKKITEKPTTFRMKVENEMIEKKSPNVNVNVSAKTIDLDKLNERLFEIQSLTKQQIDYEGK